MKTLELDPTHPRAYYYLGRVYIGKGMLPEAVAMLEKGSELSGADRRIVGVLGHAYALMRRTVEVRHLLEDANEPAEPGARSFSLYRTALICLGLGETDRALECMKEICDAHSILLRWVKVDQLFDTVRADRRFRDILKRMDLEP
jgi:tetratricopeptide (TPR) repeat protein